MEDSERRSRIYLVPLRIVARVILGSLAGLGLVFVVATVTPVDSWWARALAGSWQPPSGEILVVLGGSLVDYGTVGGSSYWRCIYAARDWKQGGFREMVVSGGGPVGNTLADAMANLLTCEGVPRTAIHRETRSGNTRENAMYTKELLGNVQGRVVLVTSDYHMFRAYRCFRKVGVDVIPDPYPDVLKRAQSWRGRWTAFLDLITETGKVIYYYFRGWI